MSPLPPGLLLVPWVLLLRHQGGCWVREMRPLLHLLLHAGSKIRQDHTAGAVGRSQLVHALAGWKRLGWWLLAQTWMRRSRHDGSLHCLLDKLGDQFWDPCHRVALLLGLLQMRCQLLQLLQVQLLRHRIVFRALHLHGCGVW